MGGKTWEEWIEEYADGHRHPVNRITHTFGIPMIVLALLMIPLCFFVGGRVAVRARAFCHRLDAPVCRPLFRRQTARVS